MALHTLQRDSAYNVVALLTTLTRGYERVSIHGVRASMLRHQADRLDLPLIECWIPPGATNDDYLRALSEELLAIRSTGVNHVAYGDLYLEDIRAFRENHLAELGMQGVYPLWGRDTTMLAQEAIQANFCAVLASVDCRVLDASYAGRKFDAALLDSLPDGIDPCGEGGEFHTFVYDAPNYDREIHYTTGILKIDENIHMAFRDLVPSVAPAKADNNMPVNKKEEHHAE